MGRGGPYPFPAHPFPFPRLRQVCSTLSIVLFLSLTGCKPCGNGSTCAAPDQFNPSIPAPLPDEFSVMTFNLLRYGIHDRDKDGQANEMKPKDECDAILKVIAANAPDVLAVQEMGSLATFEQFAADLAARGFNYPHRFHLDATGWKHTNLGLLSRHPFASVQGLTNDVYTVGPEEHNVSRGFIDAVVQVNTGFSFRIFVAHLKSKLFHPMGQTEMRRNEARLLSGYVRDAIEADPSANIVVVGDMNDSPRSKPLRTLLGEPDQILIDTRPSDWAGSLWTHRQDWYDEYSRIDYILLSKGLHAELVPEKTRAVLMPEIFIGSDHRPLVAVFKNQDQPIVQKLADTPSDRDEEQVAEPIPEHQPIGNE